MTGNGDFCVGRPSYRLQNDRENREGDDNSGCENAHLANFAGKGAGVNLGAGALRPTRTARALPVDDRARGG